MPAPVIVTRETVGKAMGRVLAEGSGLKCPYGCRGCAARMYGLVRHLMDGHGVGEKRAWKMAEKEME